MSKKALLGRAALLLWLAGIALMVSLSACVLPNCAAFLEVPGREIVSISADQITLQWDAPAGDVSLYTVYYRTHGSQIWTELGDAPAAPAPEYTVSYATLPGNNEYEFAVVAEYASGQKSAFHTSLDSTAQPTTGWYVSWQK